MKYYVLFILKKIQSFSEASICIGWMDLVLAWEDEEQKGIQ